MNSTVIIAIISSVLGSGALFTFIQFLISRHDKKNSELVGISDRLDSIDKKMEKSERDSCRSQMLILMSDYPEEKAELMRLAEHYFKDLNGDWYMTDLFCKHLIDHKMEKPPWFKGE